MDAVSGRRRILVVDDDAAIREVMTQAFLEEGYEVATAADGVSALDAMATATADLIVLDLCLAGPLSGPAVASAYGRFPGPRAPVLIVSAQPEADLTPTARAIGAAGVLSKPFDLDVLLDTVARLLPTA